MVYDYNKANYDSNRNFQIKKLTRILYNQIREIENDEEINLDKMNEYKVFLLKKYKCLGKYKKIKSYQIFKSFYGSFRNGYYNKQAISQYKMYCIKIL